MQQKPLLILSLFAALIFFTTRKPNFSSINSNNANIHSTLIGDRYHACVILLKFDDGTISKQVINKGESVITVIVKKTSPIILTTSQFLYAEGKPSCDVYNEDNDSIGHIDIHVILSFGGSTDKVDALKDYKDIISQKITSQLTI